MSYDHAICTLLDWEDGPEGRRYSYRWEDTTGTNTVFGAHESEETTGVVQILHGASRADWELVGTTSDEGSTNGFLFKRPKS